MSRFERELPASALFTAHYDGFWTGKESRSPWGARRPEQLNALQSIAPGKPDPVTMLETDRMVACVNEPVGPELIVPSDRLAA
jgi:hypothetical protein